MAETIYPGATQHLTATFYGITEDGDEIPHLPDTLEVRIYNTATNPDTLLSTEEAELSAEPGKVFFDWTPTEQGEYNVQFYGYYEADDYTALGNNYFTVSESPPAIVGNLGEDFELLFAGVIDPLLVDPDELSPFFPSVSLVEIAEQIHYASIEVLRILNGKEVTETALQYVKAAAACALSRIHESEGWGGTGPEESVTLGDLSVRNSSSSNNTFSSTSLNAANATTWCELAIVLKKELLRTLSRKMVATQKAGYHRNPMPRRHVRRLER